MLCCSITGTKRRHLTLCIDVGRAPQSPVHRQTHQRCRVLSLQHSLYNAVNATAPSPASSLKQQKCWTAEECVTQRAHCKVGIRPPRQSRAHPGGLRSCHLHLQRLHHTLVGGSRVVAHRWLASSPSYVPPPGSSAAHPCSGRWAASASVLPSHRPGGEQGHKSTMRSVMWGN